MIDVHWCLSMLGYRAVGIVKELCELQYHMPDHAITSVANDGLTCKYRRGN